MGGAPLVVPPPTEPGSTRQAAPDVLTWVGFKQSLGWTFPICTGTTAVHLSVTQSTNDYEAASSDATTTITTKNIYKYVKTNKVQRRVCESSLQIKTQKENSEFNILSFPTCKLAQNCLISQENKRFK